MTGMWAQVPECYRHAPPRLQAGYFTKFAQETLFYIFYSMPGDEAQLFAADELQHRGWAYHKEFKVGPAAVLPVLPICPVLHFRNALVQTPIMHQAPHNAPDPHNLDTLMSLLPSAHLV